MWYDSCIQCHQIWHHIAIIPFLCVCWTCDKQDAFWFWMFYHTMCKEYLLHCGHPCYVVWVFFGTWIVCHRYYKQSQKSLLWILVSSGNPLQARVCFRLTLKLCLETFTFLMTGATQASCRNKWLSVLLWDLKGLRGKRIAQNMGTKIGLIKLIYFVIFCAGCILSWIFTMSSRCWNCVNYRNVLK